MWPLFAWEVVLIVFKCTLMNTDLYFYFFFGDFINTRKKGCLFFVIYIYTCIIFQFKRSQNDTVTKINNLLSSIIRQGVYIYLI